MFLQEVCLLTWCCSCAAAFTIVLVSWARGGQLGRRGRGYQVRSELLERAAIAAAARLRCSMQGVLYQQ